MSSTIKALMDLTGRRAIVTGAAGNLGRVIADVLAELGADLVIVDRPGSPLWALAQELRSMHSVGVDCRECDLESDESRNGLVADLNRDYQEISVLVNNAAFVGTSELTGWGVPFHEQTVETWRRALEVNLTAAFGLCQGLHGMMARATGASIINVGSIYGLHGPDWGLYEGTSMANPAAYGASKGGLLQLTRWLATTVAPRVRVNAISPGGIFRNQPETFVARYEKRTPLGRMATEDDFRGVIAYLSSDLSGYVTGQNIQVDGGFGVW
jgi:NAD(P)-dependent dehydrogenase (short-subunit alcohol dehydrogenase family)